MRGDYSWQPKNHCDSWEAWRAWRSRGGSNTEIQNAKDPRAEGIGRVPYPPRVSPLIQDEYDLIPNSRCVRWQALPRLHARQREAPACVTQQPCLCRPKTRALSPNPGAAAGRPVGGRLGAVSGPAASGGDRGVQPQAGGAQQVRARAAREGGCTGEGRHPGHTAHL